MSQAKLSFSLRCPDPNHGDQVIGSLNLDPNARKIGYCFDCRDEVKENDTAIFKSVSN